MFLAVVKCPGAEGTVLNSVRSTAAVARVIVRSMNSRRRAGVFFRAARMQPLAAGAFDRDKTRTQRLQLARIK
jgi:hypothetical protein